MTQKNQRMISCLPGRFQYRSKPCPASVPTPRLWVDAGSVSYLTKLVAYQEKLGGLQGLLPFSQGDRACLRAACSAIERICEAQFEIE